jgi:hypothetical protein
MSQTTGPRTGDIVMTWVNGFEDSSANSIVGFEVSTNCRFRVSTEAVLTTVRSISVPVDARRGVRSGFHDR